MLVLFLLQGRSVGVWHPGQEVKLVPLGPCPEFFPENFQNGRQAKLDKTKTTNNAKINIYPFLQEQITDSELLSDL